MNVRKIRTISLGIAAAACIGLSGCAAYYDDGYYPAPAYGPSVYVAPPPVYFGPRFYGFHHHWHHWHHFHRW